MFHNPLTERLAGFVRGVGIDAVAAELPEPTFLPGLDVRFGVVLIDEARLSYPGDILHEAGHVAVSGPAERKQPKLAPTLGDEIAAIAWSYAAVCYLGIDPAIVFTRAVIVADRGLSSRISQPVTLWESHSCSFMG